MSNWETWGASPVDIDGTETLPVNKAGVSKYTTINKIKAFIGAAYDAAGTAAAAIATHLGVFDHTAISHANRTALNNVSGTNTGDQDLSPYAPKNAPAFTGTSQFGTNATKEDVVVYGAVYPYGKGAQAPTNTVLGTSFAGQTNAQYTVAIGAGALDSILTASYNVAVGAYALKDVTTGDNVAIGSESGRGVLTGASNVFIGSRSGSTSVGQSNSAGLCTAIGYQTYAGAVSTVVGASSHATGNNSVVIGANVSTTADNQVTIGSSSVTETQLRGNVIAPALTTGITTLSAASYTVPVTVASILANYAGGIILTLPSASSFPGRMLTVKTLQAQTVTSSGNNVVPLAGGAAGTAILAATAGKFAQLQSDGTNWQIMMAN